MRRAIFLSFALLALAVSSALCGVPRAAFSGPPQRAARDVLTLVGYRSPGELGTRIMGPLVLGAARAGGLRQRRQPPPVLLPYGPDGLGESGTDGTYYFRSPDRRFIAQWRIEMPNTSELALIDAQSRKVVVHLPDMSDFLWVPHHPHRLVVAGGGPFGHGFLWMWEGGRRWRNLLRLRRPKEESCVLFGVTRDGQFLIYGHGPSGDLESYDPPHRRQWLHLPPASARQRLASLPPAARRLYWAARYMGKGADLQAAALAGANLAGADLEGTNLARADLAGADLSHVRMWNGNLERANLHGARLIGADLRGVQLDFANLGGADLTGATLEKKGFEPAELTGARYDVRTRWPKGFDPQQHGAVFIR